MPPITHCVTHILTYGLSGRSCLRLPGCFFPLPGFTPSCGLMMKRAWRPHASRRCLDDGRYNFCLFGGGVDAILRLLLPVTDRRVGTKGIVVRCSGCDWHQAKREWRGF